MGRQKHFITLFLGTGLNVILGVITTPIVTRLVAPEVYGELSLFTLYGSIFLIMCTLGTDQAYNRYFFVHDTFEFKQHVLRKSAKLPLVLSVIAGIAIILYYMFFDRDNYVLPIFAVYGFALVLNRYTNLTMRLQMKSKRYVLAMNLQKLSYTFFVVCAILLTNVNHLYVLTGATLGGYIVSTIVGISSERKLWKTGTFFGPEHLEYNNSVSTKDIIKYSWPFIFTFICDWVFSGADKVMLEIFSNEVELGIYASAATVVGIFSIITNTFNTIWAPMAVEEYEKGADTSFFVKATDYVSVILFAAGVWVILLKDVIVFLLGPEYRAAAMLLPALTLHPIMYAISESTVYGINFKKKTHYHIIVTFTCSVVNIILNYLLIPVIGALGASIATGITYTFLFGLRTWLSVKCFPVKYNLWKIGLLLVLYYIFIGYSSFHTTDMVCVIMFTITSVVGITIYWSSIKDLWFLLLEYLKSFKKKKPNSNN